MATEELGIVSIALVGSLLRGRRPAYITRLIVAVDVDPVQRIGAARSLAYIGEEYGEVTPAITDANTATSVTTPRGTVRISTAPPHSCPGSIERMSTEAVPNLRLTMSKATAALRPSASEIVSPDDPLATAVAPAPPINVAFTWGAPENFKASVATTYQVNSTARHPLNTLPMQTPETNDKGGMMDPQTQDRLQQKLEDLIDDAAESGVHANELREWLLSEAEYQIKGRVDGGEFS